MAGRQYGAHWTKMRNQRIRQAADHQEPCCRCGQPIDYQLPGNTRWGPTLDHLDPLAHGGDMHPDPDRLAPAHLHCNSRHGGRIGNTSSKRKPAVKNSTGNRNADNGNSGKPILLRQAPEPLARPFLFLSEKANISTPFTVGIRFKGNADGVPLIFPAPHPEAVESLGDHAAAWIEARMAADRRIRAESLRWWQWLVLQRLLERRADGSWCWPVTFVSVSRQQGKSELLCELASWRCAHPDLFGGRPQDVGHSASTVVLSRLVQSSRWFWARQEGLTVARQLGDSQVVWPDGSTWRTMAPQNMYGRSLDLVLADESWSWDATDFWQSTFPTLVERPSSQAVMWSAAHDEPRSLVATLMRNESVGVMLWGAAAGSDVKDPEVWRAASAFWSESRGLAMRTASGESSFGSQWLNMWPEEMRRGAWGSELVALLPPESDVPWSGPLVMAVESDLDGGSWGAAVSDGVHVLCVSVRRRGEAFDWLAGFDGVSVLVCHDAVVRLVPQVFPVPVEKMTSSSARSATSLFKERVRAGGLSWRGVLSEQLARAEVSGGSGMEHVDAARSGGSVSALKAAMWALWRASFDDGNQEFFSA